MLQVGVGVGHRDKALVTHAMAAHETQPGEAVAALGQIQQSLIAKHLAEGKVQDLQARKLAEGCHEGGGDSVLTPRQPQLPEPRERRNGPQLRQPAAAEIQGLEGRAASGDGRQYGVVGEGVPKVEHAEARQRNPDTRQERRRQSLAVREPEHLQV